MANPNAAFGFRPVRHANGAPFSTPPQLMYLAAGEANNIFIGDLVKLAGDADALYGVATVTKVAAGNTPVGVVVGFDAVLGGLTPNLNITYRPASTAQYVYVVTDPSLVFEVQTSGSLTSVDVGLNADLTVATAGSTTTGVSGMQLDATTKATTNTLGFHIIGKSTLPNNAFGTNVVMEVQYNLHAYGLSTAGV